MNKNATVPQWTPTALELLHLAIPQPGKSQYSKRDSESLWTGNRKNTTVFTDNERFVYTSRPIDAYLRQ